MLNLRNLKFVKTLESLSPKFKWLMFTQLQNYKINSSYIDLICADENKEPGADALHLENMVRETLIKEFSPEVQNLKSYDLLVDACVHNIKKKQLNLSSEENHE